MKNFKIFYLIYFCGKPLEIDGTYKMYDEKYICKINIKCLASRWLRMLGLNPRNYTKSDFSYEKIKLPIYDITPDYY
jgi:hypothetical protein